MPDYRDEYPSRALSLMLSLARNSVRTRDEDISDIRFQSVVESHALCIHNRFRARDDASRRGMHALFVRDRDRDRGLCHYG